ncbi:putative monooxygenase moxC [Calycina marina]|uniref:Monooxygenase moxC n=1 Tax=Calycina marina TaxID=1763456 RepID=A0A9P7YZ83_9HELO|nr:putative monooxygenase moxC [Calycina marina]
MTGAARELSGPKDVGDRVRESFVRRPTSHVVDLSMMGWQLQDSNLPAQPVFLFSGHKKIHKIAFRGKHFDMTGQAPSNSGPQCNILLFQAGNSKDGKEFGAKHSEDLFIAGRLTEDVALFVNEMRDLAGSFGRDRNDVKFFPMITPIMARMLEEAEAKRDAAEMLTDSRGGLVKVSSFLGMDLGKFPLDQPLDMNGTEAGAGVQTIQLGANFSFCDFGNMPTETPEMLADRIADWANIGCVDGRNLSYVSSNPGSYEDIVEMFVPVLQERALMQKDYGMLGGSFREKFFRVEMPRENTAAKYRYENLKKTAEIDTLGNVMINRRPKDADVEDTDGESKVKRAKV